MQEYINWIIEEELSPEILRILYSYIQNNDKLALAKQAPMLLQLKSDPEYSDILEPSGYSFAYRIMDINQHDMKSIIGRQTFLESPLEGVTGPGELPSHGGISGWSISTEMLQWSSPRNGHGTYVCIFKCSIDQNQFFGNPGALAKALKLRAREAEKEVIAVGVVNYNKMAYVSYESSSYEKAVTRCIQLLNQGPA